MSLLERLRIMACAGVRMCKSLNTWEDNDRRGQDKSGGPVGAYAVVVVGFSDHLALGPSAASALKSLRMLSFLGTTAVSPIR